MSRTVDLRSDTVTMPTESMRRAMAAAEVGDDVYREDPTVRVLEEECAQLLGHEAALFVPTGTMGNQIAIHLLTRPGDEVLIEGTGHSYDWELSGMAVISGVQPRVLVGHDGVFDPATSTGRPVSNKAASHMTLQSIHGWPKLRPMTMRSNKRP